MRGRINAAMLPASSAFGLAIVAPTASLLFSIAGLCMKLLKVLLAGDICACAPLIKRS